MARSGRSSRNGTLGSRTTIPPTPLRPPPREHPRDSDALVTGEGLGEARRSGAKGILAGDDRQLASIERGGLFTEMRQRHGAAEISEITRQRSGWQRAASRDLAEGRFADAVAAFDTA